MDEYQVVAYDHRGFGDSEKPHARTPGYVGHASTCPWTGRLAVVTSGDVMLESGGKRCMANA
jgi:pimeloyl-ACP methyl ester carboxylesterase